MLWTIYLLLLSSRFLYISFLQCDHLQSKPMCVYDSTFLKSLRPTVNTVNNNNNDRYDQCIKIDIPRRKNKRGRKGGVKTRMVRRRNKPVLPVVVAGNVRSINNKTDELQACVQYMNEYRNASMVCLSETWLHTAIADSTVQIDNFTLIRCDRDLNTTKKTRGGGVCTYVN